MNYPTHRYREYVTHEDCGPLSLELAASQGLHFHCENCHDALCCSDGVANACPLTNCAYCSVRLHDCKKEDHEEVCANMKVECINASFGCSKRMRRSERGKHLEHCPASVIRCPLTRCRLPVSTYFEGLDAHLQTVQSKGLSTELPLDIALLIRDFVSFRQQKNETATLLLPTSSKEEQVVSKGGACGDRTRVGDEGEVQVVCALCTCKSKHTAVSSMDDSTALAVPKCYSAEELEQFNAKLKADSQPKSCKTALFVNLKKNSQDENGNNQDFISLSSVINDAKHSATCTEPSNCQSLVVTQSDGDHLVTATVNQSANDTKALDNDLLNVGCALNCNQPIQAVTNSMNRQTVPFDMSFEYPTRWNLDARSRYQFACGQLLRRDEYASHVRNVHVDTLTQLNWCEQRCPMAYRGCTFVLRRLVSKDGRAVRYLPAFDCLAARGTSATSCAEATCDRCGRSKAKAPGETTDDKNASTDWEDSPTLTDLPVELLVLLSSYLDPLSLRALSATCSSLRSVCAMLLADRGCVTLQWLATSDSDGRLRWSSQPGLAFLSNSFETVQRWHVLDAVNAQIASHLRTCAFNERVAHDPRNRFVTAELRNKVEVSSSRVTETSRERNPFVCTLQRFLNLNDRD